MSSLRPLRQATAFARHFFPRAATRSSHRFQAGLRRGGGKASLGGLWKLAGDVSGDARAPTELAVVSQLEIRDAPCTIIKVCEQPEHHEPYFVAMVAFEADTAVFTLERSPDGPVVLVLETQRLDEAHARVVRAMSKAMPEVEPSAEPDLEVAMGEVAARASIDAPHQVVARPNAPSLEAFTEAMRQALRLSSDARAMQTGYAVAAACGLTLLATAASWALDSDTPLPALGVGVLWCALALWTWATYDLLPNSRSPKFPRWLGAASWFIPVANLALPLLVIRDIWRKYWSRAGHDPATDPHSLNPDAGKVLWLWWPFFLYMTLVLTRSSASGFSLLVAAIGCATTLAAVRMVTAGPFNR